MESTLNKLLCDGLLTHLYANGETGTEWGRAPESDSLDEYKRLRAELGEEFRAIQTDLTASPLPNSSNYQMGSISEPERYQNHNLAVSANLRGKSKLMMSREGEVGVTDGTRTRNSQNHNLGLYH